MPIKHLISPGIGFSPGSVKYLVTRGLSMVVPFGISLDFDLIVKEDVRSDLITQEDVSSDLIIQENTSSDLTVQEDVSSDLTIQEDISSDLGI